MLQWNLYTPIHTGRDENNVCFQLNALTFDNKKTKEKKDHSIK